MKKRMIMLLILFTVGIKLSAQNKFEKGYIINSDGSKFEGLIKNLDWSQSPSQIEFKEDNTTISRLIGIDKIKGFEIDNKVKYIKAEVDVDISSDDTNSLDDDEKPRFIKKTAFLKAVVEGEFTLYKYNNDNVIRFFYNKENHFEPLIFKRYLISGTQITKNNKFISQLKTLSNCDNISTSEILNLEYKESDLKDIFIKFNTCGNVEYKNYSKETYKNLFHLSIRPGINFSSLNVDNHKYIDVFGAGFERQTNFRVGLEFEFVLPFNNNKWSIIAEPTYQYFKAGKREVFTKNILGEDVSNSTSIKYSSIEVPIGIRYYAFLNEKSKLFFNASFIFDAPLGDSEVSFQRYQFADETIKIEGNPNFGFGIGYKFDDKFSLEFNIHTKRNLFKSDVLTSEYKNYSIVLGYALF